MSPRCNVRKGVTAEPADPARRPQEGSNQLPVKGLRLQQVVKMRPRRLLLSCRPPREDRPPRVIPCGQRFVSNGARLSAAWPCSTYNFGLAFRWPRGWGSVVAARSRGRPWGGVGPSTMSMLLPARVMTSLKITALTLRSLRMRGLTTWLCVTGHHNVCDCGRDSRRIEPWHRTAPPACPPSIPWFGCCPPCLPPPASHPCSSA